MKPTHSKCKNVTLPHAIFKKFNMVICVGKKGDLINISKNCKKYAIEWKGNEAKYIDKAKI